MANPVLWKISNGLGNMNDGNYFYQAMPEWRKEREDKRVSSLAKVWSLVHKQEEEEEEGNESNYIHWALGLSQNTAHV